MQTNTNNVNKTRVLLQQLDVKMNRTLFLCGNRNGHHNTELRHIIGQHKKLKRSATQIHQKTGDELKNSKICHTTLWVNLWLFKLVSPSSPIGQFI